MISRIVGDLRAHPVRWLLALFLVLLFFPQLDIAFATFFYEPGVGFPARIEPLPNFVRVAAPDIIVGGFVICVVLWLVGLVKKDWPLRFTTPSIAYLLATLLFGPGLIVEALLKSHWGRVRPNDTTLFGGDGAYTPPWMISDGCSSNCSFVSGHAAIAFWLTAYAFLLPPERRLPALLSGVLIGLAMGLVRMAQGGHFFSDIIAAGLIVLAVNTVLARVMLRPNVAA